MNKFIFDVDGTLTPSRQKIDDDFGDFFLTFCDNNSVYLVTGSDRDKTIEQLGEDIYNSSRRVYNCSGNDVWEGSLQIRCNDWVLPELAHEWLSQQLTESRFMVRAGNHFEHRTGVCNFSIVGRNADLDQRSRYTYWDKMTGERKNIVDSFNNMFSDISATVGGETGLDIHPTGKDKSQIIQDFDKQDTLYFFGDRIDPQGNDYSLSKLIPNSHNVIDWADTHRQLQLLQMRGLAK